MEAHAISVDMSEEGAVTVKVDGKQESGYLQEIKESGVIDKSIENLYSQLLSAYKKMDDYYLYPCRSLPTIVFKEDVEKKIRKLRCKKYQKEPLILPQPALVDIEVELKEEARNRGITEPLEIEKFVAEYATDNYNYRLIKWENINKFYTGIQDALENKINSDYKAQYEQEKAALIDVIDGSPSTIDKGMKELESTLKIPFSTEISYAYDQNLGKLDLTLEMVTKYTIPRKKAIVNSKGTIDLFNLTGEEYTHRQSLSIISYLFYIAFNTWDLSPKIKEVNITLWQLKNQTGWCWFTFKRDQFKETNFSKFDIIEQCKTVQHVFDLQQSNLFPIRSNLFEYAIQKGFYNDKTLIDYATRTATPSISKYTDKVDKPTFEPSISSTSLNDMDTGYNFTHKPRFDSYFAHFCFNLIGYDSCSIQMLVTEFNKSLDEAKDIMGKLVYAHLVGGKDSSGSRPLLFHTERELEYKLSWLYSTDVWNY